MAENTINSDLIRGHIDTIILRSLYDGDKHGNEICLDIEDKSGGQYELKQPTLYSALKRLETSGYVTAYWQSGVGGRRRYFKLTEEGKKLCDDSFSNWIHSRNVIDKLLTDGGDLGYVVEEPKKVTPKFNADEYKNYTFSPIPSDDFEQLSEADQSDDNDSLDGNELPYNDELYSSSVISPSFGQQVIKRVDDTDEETQRLAKDNEYNLSFLSKSKSDDFLQMSLIDDDNEKDEETETSPTNEDNDEDNLNEDGAVLSDEEVTDETTETEDEPDDGEEIVITVHEAVKPSQKEEIKEDTRDKEKETSEYSDKDDDTLDIVKYRTEVQDDADSYKDILEKLFPKEESEPKKDDYDKLAEDIDIRDDDDEIPSKNDETIEQKEKEYVDVTPSAITVNQETRQPKPKKETTETNGIDYSDILALAHMQGFKVRTADRTNYVPQGKLFINKLISVSATLLSVLLIAEATALCFPLKDVLGISYTDMLYVLTGIAVFPIVTYVILAINPNKTVDNITEMKYAVTASFVAVLNLLLLTFAVDLIIRIDFGSVRDLLLYLVFPFILYLNIPMYFFIKYLLISAGCCFSNDK